MMRYRSQLSGIHPHAHTAPPIAPAAAVAEIGCAGPHRTVFVKIACPRSMREAMATDKKGMMEMMMRISESVCDKVGLTLNAERVAILSISGYGVGGAEELEAVVMLVA